MKRNYIRIHRNILASWVFADPQSLYVLLYLILQADPETGQVRASQREMANYLRMPLTNLQRILTKLVEKGSLKVLKVGHQTSVITICNYARYQSPNIQTRVTKLITLKERKEKEKKNLPPHPLVEEKKDKRKKCLAGADNFSDEKLTPHKECASRDLEKCFTMESYQQRRAEFARRCHQYDHIYGAEMINDFFAHYSETNEGRPGKMLFEKQKTFQISLRLAKWKRHGVLFGEDRTAHRRKQNATTQSTTLNAKETATMEARFENQQQREAQWKERSRKAVTYEEYQRMKAEGKIK